MTTPSWQSRLLAQVLARTVRPLAARAPLNPTTVRWARKAIDRAAFGNGRLPAGTTWHPVSLGTCQAEMVRGPVGAPGPVLLYFHGGGFLAGSARAWRPFVAALSVHTGLSVLSVDYRRVPEHTVADAVDDGLRAYRWLLAGGLPEGQIVLAGDSAGGGIAFSLAVRLRAEGLPAAAGIVAISPWLDVTAPRTAGKPADPLLAPGTVRRVAALCAEGRVPEPSPVHAEVHGLPPALILAGERDLLRGDSELMARRLHEAGVACELQIWPGQAHAFPLARILPESAAALREIARFLSLVTAS